ncbi:MAG: hypothetical protein PVJ33_16690 [Lysobacterales bacterium]|jgi:hypothetical protein
MKSSTQILTVTIVILGLAGVPDAFAKGTSDNPTTVQIDEQANTVKIDPDNNDVDVNALPAVKIDASQNDVDAVVTNEVEIKNDSGAALAVDTGAAVRLPYAQHVYSPGSDNSVIEHFSVPEGQIFVIEQISASFHCIFGCDGIWSSRITLTTGGSPMEQYLAPVELARFNGTDNSFAVSQSVRLYADAGSTVTLLTFSMPDTSSMSGTAYFSGYLIPEDEFSLAP